MKSIFIFINLFFFSSFIQITAQVSNVGQPKSWELKEFQNIEPIHLGNFDLESIQNEDKVNDRNSSIPYRFGYKFEVNYSIQNSGVWETLSNGDRIWRIRFFSENAKSLNFILEDFFIPIGANLFLYNNEKTDLLGAYTFAQNNEQRKLGTWLVKGNDIVLEYFEPATVAGKGSFTIKNITHGYRLSGNLNSSNHCNIDVNCPIGNDADPLKNIVKKSVALVLVNGAAMCSGALINNTANDRKPYFLTADHCYSDPSTWAFKFNWISTNTVCGTDEDNISNEDHHTISGATLKARKATTDFCLVEINSEIPVEWETVWSGWDRTNIASPWVFGIHHPNGDIMKTCRDSNPILLGDMWSINNWEMGVTESGSSGSPLFNNNGRIIGQLCCGEGFCVGNVYNGGNNRYGRFDISWNGGNTPNTRLKDWLDPLNTGVTVLDTFPILNMGTSENTSNQIKVYPNPSNDIFKIDLQSLKESVNFELVTADGSLISKGKFSKKINEVSLSALPKGIYIIKIASGKKIIKTFKLLKQ